MNQDKLAKLKKLVEVANEDNFSYKEAVKFFEVLVKVIKDTKEQIKNDIIKDKEDIKKQGDITLNKVLKDLEVKGNNLLSDIINKIETKHEERIRQNNLNIKDLKDTIENTIKKDLETIRQSIPKDVDLNPLWAEFDKIVIPSSSEIELAVQTNIENNLPQYGEKFRDGLELLNGDNRLDKSAIKGLDELLKELEEKISTIPRGSAVTNMRIAQAFKYILKTEQPVGDINGVNTIYTLSQPIFAIMSVTINGEVVAQLPNYNISGNKITFSSALPAVYSGKDWEIKYI